MKTKIPAIFIILFIGALAAIASDLLTIRQDPAQSGGVQIQTTASEKLAFHGVAPVVLRANAAQVAVSTNALTVSTNYVQADVTAIATRASALTTLVNELRAALVEKGLILGTTNAP